MTNDLDPRLAWLLDHWNAKRGDRAMPARADINPTEIRKDLLPFVALVEPVDAGARFRFRLCGTGLESLAGLDLTGRFIDELNPNRGYAAYIEGLYRAAMERRRPLYSESEHVNAASSARRLTMRLICPLGDDGAIVNMFVAGQTARVEGNGVAPTLTFSDSFASRAMRAL